MEWDVIVVGAGTAGAAAAAGCAEGGLRCLLLDRGRFESAGARWVNGVPLHSFAEAGLQAPGPGERRGGGHPFHIVAGWGPQRVLVRDSAVLEIDMRALVRRLQERAARAGAELREGTAVVGFDGEALDAGERLKARWFVDASGLTGARLLGQAAVPKQHLCAAAQYVHELADPAGAGAFFEQHGVRLGETLCLTGVSGGFSVLNVRSDGETVSVLTGTVPGPGVPSGARLLDDFVREQPWIGPRLFGGARAIPIRRPRDVIASGRVALLGDAACQVFPAHGSGVAPGLVAARVLADELVGGRTVGTYGVRWQREHGGRLAAYDLFRRFSQRLPTEDLRRLMTAGLIDEDGSRLAMEQRWPALHPRAVPGRLLGALREPALAARFLPVIASMPRLQRLYARYPADPAKIPAWSARVARLFGDPPDTQVAPSW